MAISSMGVRSQEAKRRVPPRPALLPPSWRAFHPPRWWVEITILVVLDVVYERLRNLVPKHEAAAFSRAEALFDFTQRIHWDVELSLNHFVVHHDWLARIANYYYSTLHLVTTAGVLIWLFGWHRRVYRGARTVLVTTTVIALALFYIVPMAPPRLLPRGGFVDTQAMFHTVGSWSSPTVAAHTNQFAAMPSLHCAWSLWVGLSIFFVARHRLIRILGMCYPLCTFLVVVSTANHFVLDCVAGWAVLGVAFLGHRLLFGHGAFTPAFERAELLRAETPDDGEHGFTERADDRCFLRR